MMMMMNCFCGMVDRRKPFSLISSQDHCQRSSPSRISDTPRAGFEPAQNLSSGLFEWSCAVVITTTPRHHITPEISTWFDKVDETLKWKCDIFKPRRRAFNFLSAFVLFSVLKCKGMFSQRWIVCCLFCLVLLWFFS